MPIEKICDEDAKKATGGAMHITMDEGKCTSCGKTIPTDLTKCYRITKSSGEGPDDQFGEGFSGAVKTLCKECWDKDVDLHKNYIRDAGPSKFNWLEPDA